MRPMISNCCYLFNKSNEYQLECTHI